MKESPVHGSTAKGRQRTAIGVRQNGLRPKFASDALKTISNLRKCLVPRDALKIAGILVARTLRCNTTHRVENPIRRIYAVDVLRHLRAQKSARHGMSGVSLNLRGSPVFHGDKHAAGIRAVMRTSGMND